MVKLVHNNLVVKPQKPLFRWKVDAYPSLVYAVCCRMTKSSYGWPQSEGFFLGHDFYWYDNWEDIWTNGGKFINKYLKTSRGRLPVYLQKKYSRAFSDLRRHIKEIGQLDFSQLEHGNFRHQWLSFFKAYSHFWFIITDVEVLSYAASYRLEKLLLAAEINISPEEASRLVSFPERSYILEEEFELLKIANQPVQQRSVVLKRHTRKFSWILNGYHGVRLADEKFFSDRLQSFLKDKKIKQYFQHLKNYYQETKSNFQSLIRKYGLSSEIVKYAKLAQQASFIQDRRKALSWQATDHIIALYRELGGRLGISTEESLYILWDEFDWAFKNPRLMRREINKRRQSCRLRILPHKTFIITKKVKEIFAIFEKEYSRMIDNTIRGTVAYAGKVQGRVQVIKSGREIKEFISGRILVTLMTSPDYISAMKKAKAIITDDGGLTCHAAIVARELKIPCIVGTRNATKQLKDGDLIEVDAGRGAVTIVKKK